MKFKVGDVLRYKNRQDGVLYTVIDTSADDYTLSAYFSDTIRINRTFTEYNFNLDQPYMNELKLKKVLGIE